MFKNKLFLSLVLVLMSSIFYVNVTNAATHTVKTDEELDEIADRYDTTVDILLKLNGLTEMEEAVTGFVLQLPDQIQNKPAVKEEKIEMLEDYEVVKTMTVEASAFTANCKGCSGKTAYGIDLRKNPNIKYFASNWHSWQ